MQLQILIMQKYLNINTFESISSTFSNTFHFQDILLQVYIGKRKANHRLRHQVYTDNYCFAYAMTGRPVLYI